MPSFQLTRAGAKPPRQAAGSVEAAAHRSDAGEAVLTRRRQSAATGRSIADVLGRPALVPGSYRAAAAPYARPLTRSRDLVDDATNAGRRCDAVAGAVARRSACRHRTPAAARAADAVAPTDELRRRAAGSSRAPFGG
jgi:hypothetical protein